MVEKDDDQIVAFRGERGSYNLFRYGNVIIADCSFPG